MKIILHIAISVFFLLAINTSYAETHAAAKAGMTLTSNAYLDKGAMPTLYTCDGKDVSPQLSWTDAPPKTAAFAILMNDIDVANGPFYHWVVYNIPSTMTELPQGNQLPTGINIGKNSFNKLAYNGPCPPKGDAHTYTIVIYALDKKITAANDSDGPAILAALKDHIIGQATLTGIYSRWIQ